ncbi:MAG: hypothetical protein JWO80_2300 [Bryobacterales bacterium]|nr:hypothetical protein [Bryobacterales bacterium]
MSELLDLVLRAHGGLDRWGKFNKVTATIVAGGGLLPMKGLEVDPKPLEGTVTIHEENTVITPFGQSDWQMMFAPERVVIQTASGMAVQERLNPRAAFAGHTLNTPWDLLHRAYFNGYARWTYLTTPFLMAMPGFEVAEIAPWQEGAERWRVLRARFPDTIASHSREQDFYFGGDFLLRRHDYCLEIAGGIPVAQYVYDIVEAGGFRFPATRRAYVRGPHLKAIRDLLLISLDLSDFRVMS